MTYDIEKVLGVPWVKKKSYRYLYQLACQKGVIVRAFVRMRKKKTMRKEIIEIEKDFENWVSKVQIMLINTKPKGWKVEHPELAFRPKKHKPILIKEAGKCRVIYVPGVIEQWVHHILILILEPIIEGSAYMHTYSSFPGRGTHKGKKAVNRWIHRGKGIRNFAQCDIRHFYDHVRYSIVREKLKRRINDSFFLHLIDLTLIQFSKMGIPLGFFVSQWLANFLLQELDYKIKCVFGVAHYVRYMDNLTFMDDNKKKLHSVLKEVKRWLGKHRLRMKGDWQVARFDYVKKSGKRTGRRISAMGFYFYRDRTLMRKHIMKHLSAVSRRISRKKENQQRIPKQLCLSFVSLMGWVPCTNSYEWYLMNVKPYVSVRSIKKIISKLAKEDNRNDKLAGRMLYTAT